MKASSRRSPSTEAVFTFLLVSLLLFLTACGGSPGLEITLKVNDSSLPDGGGPVQLTAEVTRGEADSVTFIRDKGADIPEVTTPNNQGDFVTTVIVTETTTFTAEATGPDGTASSTPAEGVTVEVEPRNPENDPKAPSSTAPLKGFETLDLVVGTPAGLAVVATTIPGVTGEIVGNVKAETKDTSQGKVTILGGTDKLEFLYEPNAGAGAKATDSFEYTVVKANREDTGTIQLELAPIGSAGFEVVSTNDINRINDSSKSVVVLATDVTCNKSISNNAEPCVRLDNNQRLMGVGSVTLDGVTLTNGSSVKPKIIANMARTRKSGTASCVTVDALLAVNPDAFSSGEEFDPRPNCEETKVIILGDDSTVEGIEITSSSTDEASSYFIAIYARAERKPGSSDNVLDGDVTIKNVTVNRSNGKPIYMQYLFPYDANNTFGNYNLTIEGLDLNDANDTLVVGNPNRFTFKDSQVELLQPGGNNAGPQPFGDNAGIQIADYRGGDVTIDNVDVFMESPNYRIDFGNPGNNAVPFEIATEGVGVTTNLVVKNSDITFGNIPSGSDTAAFRVKGSNNGTVVINQSESVNNTSRVGSNDGPEINRIGNVSGTIRFN